MLLMKRKNFCCAFCNKYCGAFIYGFETPKWLNRTVQRHYIYHNSAYIGLFYYERYKTLQILLNVCLHKIPLVKEVH